MTVKNKLRYRPLTWLMAFLCTVTVLHAAAGLRFMWLTSALQDAKPDVQGAVRALGTFEFALASLTQTVLMLWVFARADSNNEVRGRSSNMERLYLLGGFFLPIYGWIHRYLVAQQLWWGSGADKTAAQQGETPLRIVLWSVWGVLGAFASVGASFGQRHSDPSVQRMSFLVGMMAFSVETLLLLPVLAGLHERQKMQKATEPQSMSSLLGHTPDR